MAGNLVGDPARENESALPHYGIGRLSSGMWLHWQDSAIESRRGKIFRAGNACDPRADLHVSHR